MPEPLLEVKNLRVQFPTEDGLVKAVDGISFSLQPGETLGIVGESGSGKSVTFLTVMGLINRRSAIVEGEVIFQGQDLLQVPKEELQAIRGNKIGMIFQDPMTSLHPFYKVGDQIAEAILAHDHISKGDAGARAVEMLDRVGIPRPDERARQYPHEFSGGMRQRAMIAMALSLNPDLLVADEPTTALDVTVQAQILSLIDRLQSEFNTAVALITHDLGVVAEHCDFIQVMYAGKLVETGAADDIYYKPMMPYTWGLLRSLPRLTTEEERLSPIRGTPPSLIHLPKGCPFNPRCPYVFDRCKVEVPELLPVDGHHAAACHLSLEDRERASCRRRRPRGELARRFRGGDRAAAPSKVTGPDEDLRGQDDQGHTSRSKSAGARVSTASIDIHPGGDTRARRRERERQDDRRPVPAAADRADIGFGRVQGSRHHESEPEADDPGGPAQHADRVPGSARVAQSSTAVGSIDRRAVSASETVPKGNHKVRVAEQLMELVGLSPEHYDRFPHEFSGGQRQRIGVRARAARSDPELHRAGRAGVGTRREHPGRGRQPPAGPPGAVQPDLPVHRPRPVRGQSRPRPGRGDVSRQDRRDRGRRTTCTSDRRTPTPGRLLSAVPGRRPDDRAASEERIMLEGDVPSPIDPPIGVPVPHTLPQCAGSLRRGRARARAMRPRAGRGLPLPAREPCIIEIDPDSPSRIPPC